MLFSKIANASIAVVASDCSVLLFFECIFEEEFKLGLFSDSRIAELMKSPEDFDYVFIDTPTALREKKLGRWNDICSFFSGRIFVLTCESEISAYYSNLSDKAKTVPYPFTKKTFFLFFTKGLKDYRSMSSSRWTTPKKESSDNLKMVPQFLRLIGSCEKLNEIKRKILMVADTDTPLIFFGESGTGKTLAAQIAHELSPRKNKPFVIANMANGNKELFESNLFGNVRGAFTDARDREGLFKKADSGTLFMDEIAELSLDCQAKLLRVIETGIFRPVGSDEEFKSDARLIFATNADLRQMVRKRLFREDLYWRIVDFPIEVPALRERRDDFPLLVQNELDEIQKKSARSFSITEGALKKMTECDWPGNFRQFKACLRRAAILSRDTGVIDEDSISF